ncbi:arylformamidase [Metabacillus iocasae]|uniref:Kynurenine formamidase n=1 Tax=Priestia iocasae TaxID=2291674 RepID=A0ABS2QUX2_9BACI|nr:arylformamidase [Metabacillus iocasae]MBM7703288.1 arylformamidase [Metabacillus iocasae]
MNRWIDVSQKLTNEIPVWPGDTPFSYQVSWSKEESGSVNVGQINMSTHTGTHIDAPFHFDDEGQCVIDLDVNLYIGDALVVHVKNAKRIELKELAHLSLEGVTRLLIRTDAWTDRTSFPATIPPVDPELVPYLAKQGIRLLGLDLPSVDALDSKELAAHHALHENGIHILEGLVLDEIEEGMYELAALPLPLVEGDGSPVRAVLRQK